MFGLEDCSATYLVVSLELAEPQLLCQRMGIRHLLRRVIKSKGNGECRQVLWTIKAIRRFQKFPSLGVDVTAMAGRDCTCFSLRLGEFSQSILSFPSHCP